VEHVPHNGGRSRIAVLIPRVPDRTGRSRSRTSCTSNRPPRGQAPAGGHRTTDRCPTGGSSSVSAQNTWQRSAQERLSARSQLIVPSNSPRHGHIVIPNRRALRRSAAIGWSIEKRCSFAAGAGSYSLPAQSRSNKQVHRNPLARKTGNMGMPRRNPERSAVAPAASQPQPRANSRTKKKINRATR
jgi:hypothetical protein